MNSLQKNNKIDVSLLSATSPNNTTLNMSSDLNALLYNNTYQSGGLFGFLSSTKTPSAPEKLPTMPSITGSNQSLTDRANNTQVNNATDRYPDLARVKSTLASNKVILNNLITNFNEMNDMLNHKYL